MDFTELKAQIEASRQTEAKIGVATFKLRLPTDHAWRVAAESHRDHEGRMIEAVAFRAILDESIIEWNGVTTRDLLPEAPEESLPFSPAARTELLDLRQDIADGLTMALGLKLIERRQKIESARKN